MTDTKKRNQPCSCYYGNTEQYIGKVYQSHPSGQAAACQHGSHNIAFAVQLIKLCIIGRQYKCTAAKWPREISDYNLCDWCCSSIYKCQQEAVVREISTSGKSKIEIKHFSLSIILLCDVTSWTIKICPTNATTNATKQYRDVYCPMTWHIQGKNQKKKMLESPSHRDCAVYMTWHVYDMTWHATCLGTLWLILYVVLMQITQKL